MLFSIGGTGKELVAFPTVAMSSGLLVGLQYLCRLECPTTVGARQRMEGHAMLLGSNLTGEGLITVLTEAMPGGLLMVLQCLWRL